MRDKTIRICVIPSLFFCLQNTFDKKSILTSFLSHVFLLKDLEL